MATRLSVNESNALKRNMEHPCKCGCGKPVVSETKRQKLFLNSAHRSRYFVSRREAAKWIDLKNAVRAYVTVEERIGPSFAMEKRLVLVLESEGPEPESENIIQRFDVVQTGSPKMFELRVRP